MDQKKKLRERKRNWADRQQELSVSLRSLRKVIGKVQCGYEEGEARRETAYGPHQSHQANVNDFKSASAV
jgi:hypothetical protein